MARSCGDYPLLSGGDINLYSLFVERAMTLVEPDGMVGLLTPSGIASDKTASVFFKGVATEDRLKALSISRTGEHGTLLRLSFPTWTAGSSYVLYREPFANRCASPMRILPARR